MEINNWKRINWTFEIGIGVNSVIFNLSFVINYKEMKFSIKILIFSDDLCVIAFTRLLSNKY